MENQEKPKVKPRHPDRVTLSPESLNRVGGWLSDLEERLKGNRVTRNDLVNFLILTHPPQLSEKETTELSEKYFDEVRFAEWALRQLKEAKASGNNITLAEIMAGAKAPNQKGDNDGNSNSKSAK